MINQKILRALLFDTRSIQRYICNGDRLRTNIGASYIVDRLFDDILIDGVLREMFPDDEFSSDSHWNVERDLDAPWQSMKQCCVAYIGGGNALLLFAADGEDRRLEVVRRFTRRLLIERPGLRVGVALGKLTLNLDDQSLDQNDIAELYRVLKRNQNSVFPAVNVPYTGLTLSCEVNGESANALINREDGVRFVSQEVAVKMQKADEANRALKHRFDLIFERQGSDIKMSDFEFPLNFEDLGQKEKNNYFAIVHVDGNNMGAKFRQCKTLLDRRKLSREIRRKTEGAFAELLLKIIEMIRKDGFGKSIKLKTGTVPIRPLIIGDDITFVCPAMTAIMFTKTMMELMTVRGIDCCGGIAIIPTAYPFFRGYTLTEQLCDSAKKSMRQLNAENGSSWLDFAILHGEQAPTLKQTRETEYRGSRGDLHLGPYRVCNSDAKSSSERRNNIENLLECTAQFKKKDMAGGKIKELRNVLQHGKDDAARFFQQLKYQNQALPSIADWREYVTDLGWSAEREPRTPYIDAIELTDFFDPEVTETWQKLD